MVGANLDESVDVLRARLAVYQLGEGRSHDTLQRVLQYEPPPAPAVVNVVVKTLTEYVGSGRKETKKQIKVALALLPYKLAKKQVDRALTEFADYNQSTKFWTMKSHNVGAVVKAEHQGVAGATTPKHIGSKC